MTREFLKTLGIEDKSVIDSIMDENGKDINAEKTKFGDYETLKTQLSDANKKIEEFGKLDFDGVKAMSCTAMLLQRQKQHRVSLPRVLTVIPFPIGHTTLKAMPNRKSVLMMLSNSI